MWLGHSVQVMMKHYLIAKDADFQAAVKGEKLAKPKRVGNIGGNITD